MLQHSPACYTDRMAHISLVEVQKIAQLCRIALTPMEEERMTKELGGILAYIEKLQELDTTDTPSTNQVTESANVERDDIVLPAPDEEVASLLKAVPDRDGRGVKVRAVFS